MNTHSPKTGKIKVNFVISHKSEIFMKDETPCGERRLFDEDFRKELGKNVEINEIHCYKPFKTMLPFTRTLAIIIYHFKNAFTVWKNLDHKAITHIFFGEESSLLRLLPIKKSVVTCLDIIPISFPKNITWYYRLFYKSCVKGLKKADRVLTVSNHTKRDLIKYLHIDPKKIKTAYWGINKIFRPMEVPATFYQKYQLDPKKKYILSVGGLDIPRKNLGALIKVFPRIVKEVPDAELIIAGYKNDQTKNPLGKYLDNSTGSNITSKIHLLEKLPDPDLCYLYNLANVFVFPTLYEGFGLPPVEAMACGTPVIASDNSSLPEAVGNAGILVDPNNARQLSTEIVRVMTDKKLHETLREKGFIHAKKFTWRQYAQDLVSTYAELEHDQ